MSPISAPLARSVRSHHAKVPFPFALSIRLSLGTYLLNLRLFRRLSVNEVVSHCLLGPESEQALEALEQGEKDSVCVDTLQQLLAFYGTTLSSVLDHLANRDTLFLRYLSTNLSNIAAQEGVGYRLRNLRKALAYTPKQMADAVGLPGSADQIESWEQERTVLAPSLLAHIATQLGVSSCWLIFGTPLKA